jgi:hypothetical protein
LAGIPAGGGRAARRAARRRRRRVDRSIGVASAAAARARARMHASHRTTGQLQHAKRMATTISQQQLDGQRCLDFYCVALLDIHENRQNWEV